jgi:hypothetical protein
MLVVARRVFDYVRLQGAFSATSTLVHMWYQILMQSVKGSHHTGDFRVKVFSIIIRASVVGCTAVEGSAAAVHIKVE